MTAKSVHQIALILLTVVFTVNNISADEISIADIEAMSGEPKRIKKAISMYESMDTQDPEIQWRLIRAYYNHYDELTECNRRNDQKKTADNGYKFAKKAYADHPDHLMIVYYYASIKSCYAEYYRFPTGCLMVPNIISLFKKACRIDNTIDDAGPERSLGLIYYALRFKNKALQHLETAVRIAPDRAANRVPLAMILAEKGRYEEGWQHIEFIRAGKFKVSSQHWREIWLNKAEEVAIQFPQNNR